MRNSIDTFIDTSLADHVEKLLDFIKNLPVGDYWLKMNPYRKNRTSEANSYYWAGVVNVICEYMGLNPKDEVNRNRIHETLKKRFNSETVSFPRRVFKVIDTDFLSFNEIYSYLEAKDFNNITAKDGCMLLPLHVASKVEERFDFGEEEDIIDYETIPKSTKISDTFEFWEYVEAVRDHYILEHNLYIPAPKLKDKPLSRLN